ncbi:membrane protein YqaA, SNARE-associated domain [Arsukibacterium tuosuense]|uniref:Membrane protein YqaA, SNARE-associated domain n=1 Tax=Arsukibacterium tuosuense TaxID=1323745 RepID=A0A285JMY5_9GAMM|nr:alkaline phosphatase [Arsukibacterium tuosuense]SNY60461.1 membrane protein YqaA, SNARE-associated domain [Arsukibacterium tuosuense]
MMHSKALSAETWLDRLDRSSYALPLLFMLSMAETLIIPIPIEAILIPWMLSQDRRRWTIATVALAGNLTAAALGYWLGVLAMEQWGDTLVGLFGGADAFDSFSNEIEDNGFKAILAVGITPTPLQIAMLAAGATAYSFLLFLLAVGLSRATRYYGLVVLVHFAGKRAMQLWRRYSKQIGALLLLLVAGWLWFQFR